jgi:hypothetical protein
VRSSFGTGQLNTRRLLAIHERTDPEMKDLWQVLVHMAEGARGESLSCEECFMFLDWLSDLLADGYRVKEVMPLADKYLKQCPECEQEHLRAMLEFYSGRDERAPAGRVASGASRALTARPASGAAHGSK